MTTTLTDAQLVSSYLGGDRGALAAIYDRYASGLYDTAAAMLSDRHDAADMVQDVFCIAAERLDQLREPERLKPWLYAVLRNEVYRRTKKRRRATPTDFQSDTVPVVVAPSDPGAEGASVAYAELAALVRSAAAGLDERDQLILELSVRQGLSGGDLADALGVSPEQTYSLVHRMRERVDKSLGAFVVAKAGRKDCPTLDEILRDWDGEFSVLIRKRVARHVETCRTCEDTKGKVAPLALFGAAPVLAAPLGLRDRVLEATSHIPIPGSGAGTATARPIRLRASDGFPGRVARRGMWWTTGVVTLVAVGSVAVFTAGGDTNDTTYDDTPSAIVAPSTVDSEPTVSSTPASETTVDDTTPTTTSPSSTPPTTNRPDTPTSGAPATTIIPIVSPATGSTTTSVAPTTTKATTTTKAPTTTTTTKAPSTTVSPALVALVSNLTSIDFGTSSTSATFTIKNPNKSAISWKLSSAQPNFFTFSPSSGSIPSNGTVNVTVTFARTTAASYTNTTTFPEGRFSFPAAIRSNAPITTLALVGAVGRPPQVGDPIVRFNGTRCVNMTLQVAVSDESAIKSVVATVSMISTTSSTTTRTVNLTDSGKGSWVGAANDLAGTTSSVSIRLVATDRNGLQTTVATKAVRPTSC
jgi:RNA polymerase sigma factor (sigma-70 family)